MGVILSTERRRALATRLMLVGLEGKVPQWLAGLGPPLDGYAGWQDEFDKISENVQRLLAFAQEQSCVDVLEASLQASGGAAAGGAAAPALTQPPRPQGQDVVVTQAMKDDLAAAIKSFGGDPDVLKQLAQSALGNMVVVERVAWQKPIAEVAARLVHEAEGEGTLWQLVAGLYRQRSTNTALNRFVRVSYPMLYQDPVEGRTAVKWAVNGSIFDALMVARRTPMVDRQPVRQTLVDLFEKPDAAPTVLTIDGPPKSGKSYLSSLLEFLVDTGSRGHPQTAPRGSGQYRYALLRPVQRGRVLSVGDAAKELFSQLGWKALLPVQTKADDGWAQEVIFEFRNQLAQGNDIVWIVADRFWGFPQDLPIIDFIVGLAREATLMGGRRKLRLVLIDFPSEPLDRFIEDNAAQQAQFERLRIDWLTDADMRAYCTAFIGALGAAAPLEPDALFDKIKGQVDTGCSGAELQRSWCTALKTELTPYW